MQEGISLVLILFRAPLLPLVWNGLIVPQLVKRVALFHCKRIVSHLLGGEIQGLGLVEINMFIPDFLEVPFSSGWGS